MTQKTISLPEDIYAELKKKKRKDESFPELIHRLASHDEETTTDIDELAGSFEENEEWDQIFIDIYNDRKKNVRLESLEEWKWLL